MGKVKKSKKNPRSRVNPLKKKPETAAPVADEGKSQVLPLINKLKSADAKEKAMAIGTLNILAENPQMRKLLLKERIVATVMEYALNDNSREVVVESFGLLRNLAIEEGYDVVKYMWRQNVWASLQAAFEAIAAQFASGWDDLAGPEKALVYDWCENVLSLVVVMATTDEVIFESVFNKIDPLLQFVYTALSQKQSPRLVHAGLDFIYEFLSESTQFVDLVSSQAEKLPLANLDAQGDRLTGVYVDGIKYNFTSSPDDYARILLSLYDTCSSVDLEGIIKLLQSTEPISADTDSATHAKAQAEARADLRALEVSLDLITSILEGLSINERKFNAPVKLSDDLLQNVLFAKVWPMITEIVKFELNHDGSLYLLNRALYAMNNFCWLMLANQKLPVQWFEHSNAGWDLVDAVVQKASSQSANDLQKTTLSIMWGISKAQGPQIKNKLRREFVDSLITTVGTINHEDDDQVDLKLAIMGFLASVAPQLEDITLIGAVGNFLMQTAETMSTPVNANCTRLTIEALNLIYDLFGDKEYPYDQPVFVAQGYLPRLEALEPQVKVMFKKVDRNKFNQLKVEAEEAWVNLGRFIEYKHDEQK
ncbi:hypothetical protein DIURU_002701 [Diutina rugosa]|uniref:SYO1-like TPR repeats domain-containing protein n=1 Tax=Diutina rugosa TaxID=5481 RepID=A0A642UVU8_DIURU|nr:uncharacterized protein DIURU_002701 [Diutina rugosa]KAA8902805.1 hypothetical protein DIURU_002701 [Diutina rugosa]